ncbi:DUF485 domain-containing protein [Streptomyces griseofuscus]|uniref:DUF485 domain-containing protein n=1 Tax=Streptomyces griseofuscus TaxID=146922 RepID=UPI0036BDF055
MSHHPPPGTRFRHLSAAPPLPQSAPEVLGHRDDRRAQHRALRRFLRTAPFAVLGCFTLFLLLSAWAPGFVTRTLVDGVPAGLLLGLLQLPVIWLAVAMYEYATHRLETAEPDESGDAYADLSAGVR